MKTLPTLATLLILSLAGCADDTTTSPLDTSDPADDLDTNHTAAPLHPINLSLDATSWIVQGESATLTGTVDRLVTLTVAHADGTDSFEANGTWNHTYKPSFGHDDVVITADDGTSTTNTTVQVRRNMQVTVEVDYDPASGREDTSHTLWWDFGGLRSLHDDPTYEDCDQPHPGQPNAHDALLDFEDASGTDLGFTPCGQFGVGIDSVDGYTSASYWCWLVNGETAELGISLLELEDGDVFTFVDCFVAFPE